MKKFIKKHKKMLFISVTISVAVSYLLDYSRYYSAFGGEDLIPIAVAIYWALKYTDEKEDEK